MDEADVDELIGIAAELQDAQRAPRATLEDVEAVAEELDIAPEYVEQAIEVLGQRRRAAAKEEADEAERRGEQLRMGALVVGGLAVLGLVVVALGGQRLDSAERDVRAAEVALNSVLDRQASLAPQLVALAGGGVGSSLQGTATRVREAESLQGKLAASQDLSAVMAKELGALRDVDEDVRLNLHHEVTGIQNRLTVERKRYDAAVARQEDVAAGFAPGLARSVGCGE